jgi:hypothetical protein
VIKEAGEGSSSEKERFTPLIDLTPTSTVKIMKEVLEG